MTKHSGGFFYCACLSALLFRLDFDAFSEPALSERRFVCRHPRKPCPTQTVRRVNPVLAEGDLLRCPAWFPLRIADSGDMSMVYLDEAAYRAASFLDERILALHANEAPVGSTSSGTPPRNSRRKYTIYFISDMSVRR